MQERQVRSLGQEDSLRSLGAGNSNALQYSYQENPMDGAWQATVHGVAKNQTQVNTHIHT